MKFRKAIPPSLAKRLLNFFLRKDLAEEVLGDLDEKFTAVAEKKSVLRAKLSYWYQVLSYLRPFAIKKSTSHYLTTTPMFKHTLLISFRNFGRYKSSFVINLIGLSTGLACVLLIYLWVNDELSFDKFHANDSRLYRVMENRVRATGIWTSPTTPGPLEESLAADMPEVERAVGSTWAHFLYLREGEKKLMAKGGYAGKDFFTIFSYPLVQGDPGKVLVDKNSIVISEKVAGSLFNTTENVIGKSIAYEPTKSLTVTGIFKDVPLNSSFQFDFVIPFEKFREGQEWSLEWGNTFARTFVLLKPNVNVADFNRKFANYIKVKTNNEITYRTPFLKKYSDDYLYGKYENGVLVGGRITYVKLFSLIALFIVVIACINFMNLSTARASRRVKEIGIKKAVGAMRGGLVAQYLSESFLMTLLSLVVALVLIFLFLPQFNLITGKHLEFSFTPHVLLAIACIALITGLVSGSYPAWYLSGFNAAAILKGKFHTAFSELIARKGLVIFQFTLSVVFIASVIVVYRQIDFMQSADLGYSKDNVLVFNLNGALRDPQKQETLISEVKNIKGVSNASSIGHTMIGHNGGTHGVEWPGKDPNDRTEFENITVSYGTVETLGMKMAGGRSFSKDFSTDTAKIIFNEAAIKFMGMTDPIGKTIKLWGRERQIVGVVKDFNFESLHVLVKPVFLRLDPNETDLLMVKLAGENQQETIASVGHLYQQMNPEYPFEYRFLDSDYQSQYEAEQQVSVLSKYFAGLAIVISCLGLFGLAAFTAERRAKEIGIRKVLGSSELGIVYLLSSDFTKVVFISIVTAIPVSYFLTSYWLSDFAYKVQLVWWYFVLPGFMALLIAWLTVGSQAWRAAMANPVTSLKSE